MNSEPLLRKVDCIRLPVNELDEAIRFYEGLGHDLIWRRPTHAGLRLPDSDAEIVVQTEHPEQEVDFLVDDADTAAERFTRAGGLLLDGPFEIEVGRCAVVEDPWGNTLVLLDLRHGYLE